MKKTFHFLKERIVLFTLSCFILFFCACVDTPASNTGTGMPDNHQSAQEQAMADRSLPETDTGRTADQPTISPTPMPTPQGTPTVQQTPESTPVPTPQPTPTVQQTPESTPVPTPQPTPTVQQTPESTPVPTPQPTPTVQQTPESTPVPTPQAIPVVQTTPEPAAPSKQGTTHVLNINTKKIHNVWCSSVEKIKPENYKETTESIEELERQGYVKCKQKGDW